MTVTIQTIKKLEAELRRAKKVFQEQNKISIIASGVCDKMGIHLDELTSNNRYRPLPDARKIVAHQARSAGHKLTAIGNYLNRDHSSICMMIKEYKSRNKFDPRFRELAKDCDPGDTSDFSLESYGIEDMMIKTQPNG